MRRNLSHIIAAAFNEPLLLEPAYARVFFCALGREMGAASLSVPQQQVQLDAPGMLAETDEYMAGGKRPARVYRVVNGIAVLPVTGTLVHRLGGMRPFSGMTGYDGIVACLQQAMADSQVRGILLDIDSPGGQAAGAFDCADMIYRLRQQKPVWALCNDTACSAAMLLASACSRRLVTQTSRIGSIGVMMSHVSYAGHLAQAGVDITLIYSGAHKVMAISLKRCRKRFARTCSSGLMRRAGCLPKKWRCIPVCLLMQSREQRPPFLKVSPALRPGWRMN